MEIFIYVLLVIIVLFGSLGIYYIVLYNLLQNNVIRINESENIIDESLRERYDLIISAKNIISDEVGAQDDTFAELEALKNKNISNFDFDRKTTECINLIQQIKKDHSALEKNSGFKEIMQQMKDSEEKIESAKSFYNKYTSKLNVLVRKFPSNVVARIHHISEKTYFDNKNMHDDNVNDFRI